MKPNRILKSEKNNNNSTKFQPKNNNNTSEDNNSKENKSEYELRMTKLETIVAILTNQNENLFKRIENLESENQKEKEENREKSRSTADSNTSSLKDFKLESIEESNESLEEENWRDTLNEKKESNSEEIKILSKKFDEIYSQFNSLKNSVEDITVINFAFSKKIDNFSKLEKTIHDLIEQIKLLKNNNTYWQAEILKNINVFNEKIMNQEILLDQFEDFERKTNSNIENIFSKIALFNNSIKMIKEVKNYFLYKDSN